MAREMTTSQADASAPAPARRRVRTRSALIAAGMKLLAERPVDSLSIDEIVEAAQVAKGSFFYHFADKQSFAREIATGIHEEVEATISEINAAVEDPARRVARGVGQFVLFALRAPEKATVLATADWRAIDPRHALNAGLRADLDLGLTTGRFDCPDRDGAMLNLIGVTDLLNRRVLSERLSAAETRHVFTSVFAFAFRGLGLSTAEAQTILDAVAVQVLHD
jgi:AcrR family transcriptional regulator